MPIRAIEPVIRIQRESRDRHQGKTIPSLIEERRNLFKQSLKKSLNHEKQSLIIDERV